MDDQESGGGRGMFYEIEDVMKRENLSWDEAMLKVSKTHHEKQAQNWSKGGVGTEGGQSTAQQQKMVDKETLQDPTKQARPFSGAPRSSLSERLANAGGKK